MLFYYYCLIIVIVIMLLIILIISAITIMKIIKKYGKMSEYGSLPNSGAVFYDIGSGISKSLVASSLLFNFSACYGIEILESLHRGAEWMLESYKAQVSHIIS
jgi:hypothetical protein